MKNICISAAENTADKNHVVLLTSTKIEIISERYQFYSGISNLRKHPEQANSCLIAEVCTNDVLNLIRGISINKAIREDQESSKLVKEFRRISYCCYKLLLRYQHFSDLAKGALVTPIDKFGTENHVYLSYRPLSASNIVLKIKESCIFVQLIKNANYFLQSFVLMQACRKLYIKLAYSHLLV